MRHAASMFFATLILAHTAAVTEGQDSSSADDNTFEQRCEREIVELHDFLADWFSGRLPKTEAAFARFDSAIAADFMIIGPEGYAVDRATVISGVFEDWGRWKADGAAKVEVKNARLQLRGKELSVTTYEEWQTTSDGTTIRLSSVVFREKPQGPNGLEWAHLHETWLPADR